MASTASSSVDKRGTEYRTLFDFVSPNDIFAKALNKYYEGERDEKTLKMLSK